MQIISNPKDTTGLMPVEGMQQAFVRVADVDSGDILSVKRFVPLKGVEAEVVKVERGEKPDGSINPIYTLKARGGSSDTRRLSPLLVRMTFVSRPDLN